jgi:WD40 repeat protein
MPQLTWFHISGILINFFILTNAIDIFGCFHFFLGRVICIAASPDGMVLSGSADTTIRLWRVNSGECSTIFRGHIGCS